jgi:flagellar basal-body rod protein FlgB
MDETQAQVVLISLKKTKSEKNCMEIGSLPVFRLAKEKMQFLSERQVTLAQNVANVDTPNYRAKDLQAPNFKAIAKGLAPDLGIIRTNPLHFNVAPAVEGGHYQLARGVADERNPDDNRVSLDDQLKKVAETQMDYNIAIGVYRKQLALFKMALGNGNAG